MIGVYCVDPIKILKFQGFDKYNQEIDPVAIDVMAYVEWKNRMIRNIAGEQVVSRGMVYLEFDGALTLQDRIEIAGVKYAILDVITAKDFSENHLEVFIA